MQKILNIIFLVVLLAAAIGIRLYFLRLPGYDFDIQSFLGWGNKINENGFWNLYSGNYYSGSGLNYPPLVPLLTSWWLSFGKLFGQINPVYFFKILPTIFEVLLVVVSSWVILSSNIKYKGTLLAVVVLQPALALVSSAWGQVDSILALMILLSFLLFEKNKYLGTILMFLALLVKPQALIAAGIYFLYLLSKRNFTDFFKQLAVFAALLALAIFSFRIFGKSDFLSPYLNSVGNFTNSSLNAFNIWWVMHGAQSWNIQDTVQTAGLTYKSLGMILFAIFEVPAIIYLFYKAKKLPEVLLVVAYSYLAFFIFPTEIHERYLFPAVALFAIPAILNKNIFWVYFTLSITFLVNIFAVLQSVYPQFPFLQYNLLNSTWTQAVAVINVLVCIYLGIYLLYEAAKTD